MGFMVTGVLLTFVLAAVFNALIIWVVSKLNLGLRVKSFGSAIVAAIVIARSASRPTDRRADPGP